MIFIICVTGLNPLSLPSARCSPMYFLSSLAVIMHTHAVSIEQCFCTKAFFGGRYIYDWVLPEFLRTTLPSNALNY